MGSLKIPKINECQYEELLASAIKRIKEKDTQWTDLTPGDPGVVLLEAFAHMTELMITRLNQLPYKAYIEFLAMIGVKLQPPVCAQTILTIKLSSPKSVDVRIAKGSRVSGKRNDNIDNPPVFIVAQDVTIKAQETEVSVPACHCQWVRGEHAGITTGKPGFFVRTAKRPIVAANAVMETLVVAIEISEQIKHHPVQRIKFNNKEFGIWREVDDFSRVDKKDFVYTVDRVTGNIQFSPAYRHFGKQNLEDDIETDSMIPPEGMEIVLWYCHGGGDSGNVPKGFLQVFKDSNPGLTVENTTAAVGGRNMETLENALLRGPQQLNSLKRAVTARDFELLAIQSSGAVSRTRAYTKSSLWRFAKPGTVGVLLVPDINLSVGEEHLVSLDHLKSQQSVNIQNNIQKVLDERKPLGISCEVNWVRYKPVYITGKIIVNKNENSQRVKDRVIQLLYQTICPKVISGTVKDWNFGQSLKSWDIYKIIASEPGVVSVEQLKLNASFAPESHCKALAVDNYQPDTWYTSSEQSLFRTVNNARGWEKINEFDNEIGKILPYPANVSPVADNIGLLAVVIKDNNKTDQIHISFTCGESWNEQESLKFNKVNDIAWLEKHSGPCLLIATDDALYEYAIGTESVPLKILVDTNKPDLKIDTIVTSQDGNDGGVIAVFSSKDNGQVYLSLNGTADNSFKKYEDSPWSSGEVSSILIQKRGPHRYLWVLLKKMPNSTGDGCYRRYISFSGEDHEGWVKMSNGWQAGNCYSIAFNDSLIYAASEKHGILSMDLDSNKPVWNKREMDGKLDLESISKLGEPEFIVTNPKTGMLLMSGKKGVFLSKDQAETYENCSSHLYSEEITIPKNWLFCSDQHVIEVEQDNESL
ncbi:MAG: baseplate J/gp47 family protein [Gammaproteobacteria bacterium]|nr:baseplate J/gp47 family protein [Gammaproteobacteria bacterium]